MILPRTRKVAILVVKDGQSLDKVSLTEFSESLYVGMKEISVTIRFLSGNGRNEGNPPLR